MLEVHNVKSPSSVIMAFTRLNNIANTTEYLPLFKFARHLNFQNGIFWMDISQNDMFQVDIVQDFIKIKVLAPTEDSNWMVKIYGEVVL